MPVRKAQSSSAHLRLMRSEPPESAPESASDDDLIEAVKRGDDRVASEIYDRLFSVVDHTLYRVLGQRGPDHDDLVQVAFEQIIVTLSRNAFARMCSLKTWASRVATNVGLNALRSRRRERGVIDRNWTFDPDFESGRDPQGRLDSRAELFRVRSLLANMKPDRVEVVLLHDVMGHELSEIAVMLGVSVPAAQSRLFRGRRELRGKLERAGLVPREAPR